MCFQAFSDSVPRVSDIRVPGALAFVGWKKFAAVPDHFDDGQIGQDIELASAELALANHIGHQFIAGGGCCTVIAGSTPKMSCSALMASASVSTRTMPSRFWKMFGWSAGPTTMMGIASE